MSPRALTPSTATSSYLNGGWTSIGGTSASAPLSGGFYRPDRRLKRLQRRPIGFANPLLYQAAATNYAADFSDITSGDNDYTPDLYTGGLYPAGTGYDMASGLGTPNGATLAGPCATTAARPAP